MYQDMLLKKGNDREVGAYYAGLCQVFLFTSSIAGLPAIGLDGRYSGDITEGHTGHGL